MFEWSPYSTIILFVLGGLAGVGLPLLMSKFLRPHKPNEEKLTTYECGEDPTGTAWGKFNIRFYVIALIFVLFETELVFLFPWAVVFGDKNLIEQTDGLWGKLVFVEMVIFIAILVIGLAYVWSKGFLEWDKPKPKIPTFKSPVPESVYTQLNKMMQGKIADSNLASGNK